VKTENIEREDAAAVVVIVVIVAHNFLGVIVFKRNIFAAISKC